MKNILFLEKSFGNSYGYYQEIINGISIASENNFNILIFSNFISESKEILTYDIQKIVDDLKNNQKCIVDAVIFGFGWTNSGHNTPNNFILEEKIDKYIILNKEYAALDKKLDWIKQNNFKAAFTVHHDFKKYQEITEIPFYHLPFAGNPELFKNYNPNLEYKFDFGFTGIVRPEQTDNWRSKVHSTLRNKDLWKDTKIYFSDHHHDSLQDYAKRICTSKIWFSTTGPADLVGTRYYEVMMTGTTLLACNRFDYLGLFKEDEHCIMFNSVEELAEKVIFYSDSKNENERMRIIKNAHDLSLKNHKWVNRGKIIYDVLDGNFLNG
jgi:hypothetical protein